MKNATHRVVILKNCNSDLISQAIFFLKDSGTESEAKILAEAEKIVAKYMANTTSSPNLNTNKKNGSRTLKILSVTLLCIGVIGAILALK